VVARGREDGETARVVSAPRFRRLPGVHRPRDATGGALVSIGVRAFHREDALAMKTHARARLGGDVARRSCTV